MGGRPEMEIGMLKTFIEIGSCDFDTNLDLINSGEWLGIMCEPAKKYYNNLEKLVANSPYRDNLYLVNMAVSDYNGMISFAEAKDMAHGSRALGAWRRGISSVLAENHKGERLFDLENNQQFINETYDVECITLDTLIAEHKWEHINYLKIDVEGHEMNILESYSWDIKPDFIKMEHTHIDDLYAAAFLKEKGYLVYTEHSDLYAIR